ncbi:MAG TPA: oligoribonuclease [Aeromicrobium sp.]|nr:oligoribonuclease [Aeromicrobium sp.]
MLAWMDLEMTGLDVDKDVIVEIATLLTDDDLNVIAEGPDLVISAPEEALDGMDEVVVNMHTKSGLLEAIRTSKVTVSEAEAATLEFLKQHCPEPNRLPLCGNSIGTDRRFLLRYMPSIEDHLHYRCIDVSTIKELARRWYPAAYKAAPEKAKGHRALDDILESVAELRHYREHMFREPEAKPEPSVEEIVAPGPA